ncbi:MAG: hypothetical protein HY865_23915 [Chloroflexi bacterium]|nr:hypothetical protein [Chloroflexota bacterium]
MSIFEQLSNNKGTVSSALGKSLAQKVLNGQLDILSECIDLASYETAVPTQKHIRSGAAKVVEIVAEKQPELVAPHLDKLLPALSVKEPQTRWMTIRTMGFCAHLNRAVAQKAIACAEKYIHNKEGLVLASSADLFLGDLGALSKKDAQRVFPILSLSIENLVANEQDWILEALLKMLPNLDKDEQAEVFKFAEHWQYSARKSTQQRARKILRSR